MALDRAVLSRRAKVPLHFHEFEASIASLGIRFDGRSPLFQELKRSYAVDGSADSLDREDEFVSGEEDKLADLAKYFVDKHQGKLFDTHGWADDSLLERLERSMTSESRQIIIQEKEGEIAALLKAMHDKLVAKSQGSSSSGPPAKSASKVARRNPARSNIDRKGGQTNPAKPAPGTSRTARKHQKRARESSPQGVEQSEEAEETGPQSNVGVMEDTPGGTSSTSVEREWYDELLPESRGKLLRGEFDDAEWLESAPRQPRASDGMEISDSESEASRDEGDILSGTANPFFTGKPKQPATLDLGVVQQSLDDKCKTFEDRLEGLRSAKHAGGSTTAYQAWRLRETMVEMAQEVRSMTQNFKDHRYKTSRDARKLRERLH